MKIMIVLEKDDIITRPYGKNIAITPKDQPVEAIIFSPDALQEFASDVAAILATRAQDGHEEKEIQEV